MSLKKKKVKKGKRNKIVDVLKKSLSKADETINDLLKEKMIAKEEKKNLIDRIDFLLKDNSKLKREVVRMANEIDVLKGQEKRARGKTWTSIIADDLLENNEYIKNEKLYDPSALVDPGKLIEIE